MTAVSSIAHRVTGTVLTLGCAGLSVLEIAGGGGTALHLMQTVGGMGPVVSTGAKFSIAFPFIYHYLTGVRHLVWKYRPGLLSSKSVDQSTYWIFAATFVTTGVALLCNRY